MFRQRQLSDPCPSLQAEEGQGTGADSGCLVFGHCLGSAPPLPGVSQVRIPQPPPCTPPALQCVWRGTSQIRRNNGLGRGQVQLRVQQRAGASATDCKTGKQCPRCYCWPQFPWLWGPGKAGRAFPGWISLTSGHFNFVLARRLAWSSRESRWAALLLGDCSRQGPAGQGRSAPPAPNFPHLGLTGRPESWPARPHRGRRLIYCPGLKELLLLFLRPHSPILSGSPSLHLCPNHSPKRAALARWQNANVRPPHCPHPTAGKEGIAKPLPVRPSQA